VESLVSNQSAVQDQKFGSGGMLFLVVRIHVCEKNVFMNRGLFEKTVRGERKILTFLSGSELVSA
jgi:hypothetical protein